MSPTPSEEDDSWYVEANCPKFFDFSVALQAPCSLDREYNPPLHDFVYQSDDESDNFFRSAPETPKSPLPKRPQHRMLSPRHFGRPAYRHRPKTSFEEFLHQHEMRQRLKNRRSVHVMGSLQHDTIEEEGNHPSPSSAPSFDRRSRYKSLPARRNGDNAQQQIVHDFNDDNEQTIDLKTPTLDSIVTPVTKRRTARQYTPSRVRNPSNIARSLFTSPRTPLASPFRRMRRRNQGSRMGGTSSGEPSRLSPEEHAQSESTSNPLRALVGADKGTLGLRLPARTTPPLPGGTVSSGSNPASRGANKPGPYIDRSAQPPGEQRPGPPLRVPRPTGSAGSTSTVTPPLPQPAGSDRGSGAVPTRDASFSRERPGTIFDSNLGELGAKVSWVQPNQRAESLRGAPDSPAKRGTMESQEIHDPDLLRKLTEHNSRLRKSGRQPKTAIEAPSRGAGGRSQTLPQPHPLGHQTSDDDKCASAQSQSQEQADLLDHDVEFENQTKNQHPLSLNELLKSENERVLQQRKQRLPERRRALQINKEKVLKRLEGQRQISAGRRKRTSARVEFTSSIAGQKPTSKANNGQQTCPSGSIRFKSSKPRNPGELPRANPPPQKQSFKARAKSAGAGLPSGDQNRNPNVPFPESTTVSHPVGSKNSRTNKIKAVTKQKMEERRLENDLQSLLSQHNNRVKNSKRGRA